MSILFMGSELSAFSPADGSCIESTNTSVVNTSFARASISLSSSSTYAESAHWTEADGIWLHADLYVDDWDTNATTTTLLSAYNSSDVEVYRVRGSRATTGVLTLTQFYWNGSAFVQLGSSFTTSGDVLNTLDVNLNNVLSGSATIYLSGTQRLTGTADLSGISGVSYIRLKSNLQTYWSQIIAADEPTIGMRVLTRYVSGAGSNTDWTGTYADIDEAVYNDADFINSTTANQVSTYVQTGPTITGYTVRAVSVSARSRRGASGPQNIELALRSSSTNYFSASKALTVGYGPVQNVWETNPATSAAFVASAIDTLQPGVKSIA